MFTRRHEQDLAEIRALAQELEKHVETGLERMRRIRQAQDRLLLGASDSEPLLAFVHIPKTAGATVTSMLAAAYSKPEVHKAGNYMRGPDKTTRKVANWHRKGGRVSIGHVPYVVFREQLPPDTRYMTFLREPVDRVLSHYHRHIRRDPSRAGRVSKPGGRPKADSLEQALVEMRLPQLNNLATRFLSGVPEAARLSDGALEEAKANLRGFAFVGIQERFEESIVLLQRILGLGPIPYVDRHVSSDRPAVEEIPDEQRALIAECNRLDAELYRFGLRLFEEAVAAAGDELAAGAERLEQVRAVQADGVATGRPRASSAADRSDLEPLVAFVHIPKTAGGAVSTMFQEAYSKAAITNTGNYVSGSQRTVAKVTRRPGGWESWQRRGGRVAIGHTPYGVFLKGNLPADTRYVTFLREPVDRVLSHYYRHVHLPGMSESEVATRGRRKRARSLEEALGELRLPQLRNLCTRFLCSHPTLGELPPSALDEARENLRTFYFVGIREHFEESLLLLQRTLGLGLVPYRDRHVSAAGSRPSVDEITDQQRTLILESNQLDTELYAFGLELFEQALAATDADFAADIERLRDAAEAAASEHSAAVRAARAWLDRELPAGSTEPMRSLIARAEAAGLPRAALTEARKDLLITTEKSGDGSRNGRRPTGGSVTAVEAATTWLDRELVAGATALRAELVERGEAAGHTRAALNHARKRLSVTKVRDAGGRWAWSRPVRSY